MTEPVTDRVWTIPNILSMLRLAGVPLFLWLLLGPEEDLWAAIVLGLSALTDWADGKIARKFGQTSHLGQLLDPAADRLYILSTLLAFVLRGFVPWWFVALLVVRDVSVGIALLILRRHGYEALQVNYLGKAATFCLLYGFPLLLLARAASSLETVTLPLAYAFIVWGAVLYLVAGAHYIRQIAQIVREDTPAVR
ncbi:CDP-alcohol phosphatidyltransferase family protein [Cumulibacter soli]|uniref:CDP-alcohol phosphatidyltransferase family protein n=1 Tax=Cumulibacter soli TaxID=2546344 RepID=UPI001067A921|nr:CDP-alcohol phosphatidyltransferase family protein [Cumulibacter soli]